MVLSNRKLKQKLRSLLAESVAAAESGKPPQDATRAEDVKRQLQSLREFLSSKNNGRPRPSTRRGGKRNKPSSPEDTKNAEGGVATQPEGGNIGGSVGSNKTKKRKREGGGEGAPESTEKKPQKGQSEGEEKQKKERKKNEKKKKKKRRRKNKKEEEDKEKGVKSGIGDGRTSGGRNENKATETAVTGTGEENGDITRKIYVGGVPYYSTEDDIRSFFEGCGTIIEVDCMTFPESGKFRGIAILTFKTEAAAKRALALDGADMGGLYLKIQPCKAMHAQKTDFSPEVVDGYNRIYVGNLSWDIAEDDLKKLFSECKVSSIRFGEDKVTGEFKGYAHVNFDDSQSLAVALKLDQTIVCGRPVRIRCAVPKKGTDVKPTSNLKLVRKSVAGDISSKGGKKKKRQTCYECGVPGHLSSSCPQKKPAGTASGSSQDKLAL